ncbi:MAG: hypothetical protein M1833_003504 [Piccolia ochrophora]|nr:MAG: hypothetical protein M1833_003504 [Piccolia ochrophora]
MLRLKPDDINYLHHALKKSNLMATESAERQGLRSTIKDIEGEKRHSTPPRPKKGVIEPRVFARFHKLDYKIDLRIPAEECFRDEPESFGIDSEEESDMIEYLDEPHTVGMVGDLVQSLSVSEVINQLSIHVQVMNCSTYYTYDIIPREDLDGDEIEWMKTQMNAVNLRVVELILERDYLRPVRELFNVKSFNLNFEMADGTFDVSQLHSRHLGLLQDLQRTVEKNWQRKQGSSP